MQRARAPSFSLGSACTLARDASGAAWSWGWGTNGRLGQGSATNQPYAAKVKMSAAAGDFLTGAYDISAGGTHSVVVRKIDGENYTVWAFGDASQGRLGNNNTTTDKLYPDRVKKAIDNANLDNIRMVAAGSAHTLALDHTGKVWAWGYNGYGAIGDGSTDNRLRAVEVKNPSGNGQLGDEEVGEIVWIAAGGDGGNNTSYAISKHGVIYAWGRNDDGELASGSVSASRTLPDDVENLKMIPAYPDVELVHSINDDLSPGNVTLTATPADLDGPANIAKVEFYSQGVKVGEVAYPGPYQHVLTELADGNYHVYAVVTDNDGNQGQSSPLTFTIRQSDPNSDDDGDGLTFARESTIGTDPEDPDSDGDRMGDGYEDYYGLNPLSAADGLGGNAGPGEHKDTDGMTNKDEADRGRIPTNATESPSITGTFSSSVAKWFGVAGVTYHFEHSTNGTTWTRHPVPLAGTNAELVLPIADVVSSLPAPFATRLVTESDAPDATLTMSVGAKVAPGSVNLTVNPVDSDGPDDIASVEFRVSGLSPVMKTSPPWTYSFFNIGEGTHQASAIVTDHSQKRGSTAEVAFSILSPTGDSDSDELPDGWEWSNFASLEQNGTSDPDRDGLPNSREYAVSSNPANPDSDGDKMGDGYENHYGLNPVSAADGLGDNAGPGEHKDTDGMTNKDEADRGRLANSETESPTITGSFPATMNAKWFGVDGVTYHFEYSENLTTWTRHPVPLTGNNAELSLKISEVVGSLPSAFHTRIATESDAPEVVLTTTITGQIAPGGVLLTATPTDPDGPDGIDRVEFYHNGTYLGSRTDPWTYQLNDLDAGSHTVDAIVIDHQGKRGFSQILTLVIDAPEPGDDGDDLPDDWEILHFGSLTRTPEGDEDGDQVTNLEEYWYGLNPTLADTDGDGLTDGEELWLYGTMPWDPDSDQDGLDDYDEVMVYHTDPFDPDSDGDGMPDGWEVQYGLNPDSGSDANLDADGDGLSNLREFLFKLDPTTIYTNGSATADGDRDDDRDGLGNVVELTVHFTEPDAWDSDGDGMPDGWEVTHLLDAKKDTGASGEHGTNGDPDHDGLSNFKEYLNRTNPREPDTDGDSKSCLLYTSPSPRDS